MSRAESKLTLPDLALDRTQTIMEVFCRPRVIDRQTVV